MRFALAFATAALLLVTTAHAANEIDQRRTIMKTQVAPSIGILSKMAKGEMAYDPAQALQAFQTMRTSTEGWHELFPAGTETGTDSKGEKTRAGPKIFAEPAAFKAELDKFHAALDAAIAAAPQDQAAMAAVLGPVGGECRACHETFRLPEE